MRIAAIKPDRQQGVQTAAGSEDFDLFAWRRSWMWIALAAITLVGSALRLYRLGEWSFWIDEVYTIRDVRIFLNDPFYPEALSRILTSVFLSFAGFSDWGARVVPALFGIINIPVLYALANRLFGRFVGLLSALLLALAPWHVYWSQNARFYTALLLFYTLGVFFVYLWLENHRHRYLILAGLFLFLAASERLAALIFVPVIAAYIVILLVPSLGKSSALVRRHLRILATIAVLFVLHQIYLVFSGFWSTLVENFFGQSHDPSRVLLAIVNDIGIPLVLLALAGGLFLLLKGNRPALFLIVGALVPIILILAVAPFVTVNSRYVLVTLPNWLILASAGVTELLRGTGKEARILALGAILVVPAEAVGRDYLYFKSQQGNRLDWRAAFARVQRAKGEGQLVVSTRPELGEYYLNEYVLWVDVNLEKIEKGKEVVWFVIDYDTSYLPGSLLNWVTANASLVDVYDGYLPGKQMRLRVYRYEPPSQWLMTTAARASRD